MDIDEERVLTEGYLFLRTIEHHLQMMDYRQTHSFPVTRGDCQPGAPPGLCR